MLLSALCCNRLLNAVCVWSNAVQMQFTAFQNGIIRQTDINRCHNTSYLVQFHNAGAKKESVTSNNYFSKIEKFITEHYEEGVNYREFSKFSCGRKGRSQLFFL